MVSSRVDDVIVKVPVPASQSWAQESHCTEGRWQIRSEAYLEGGDGGKKQLGTPERHFCWNWEAPDLEDEHQ